MFSIISVMFAGIGIGYVLRNLKFLHISRAIGSNSLSINYLGKFGSQAIILASLSIFGSMLASLVVFRLFFKKGGDSHEG